MVEKRLMVLMKRLVTLKSKNCGITNRYPFRFLSHGAADADGSAGMWRGRPASHPDFSGLCPEGRCNHQVKQG
jgi:hypothetical protein